MKIVFFGTAEFAVPALEAVATSITLVVSQPDRPSGRGLTLSPSPVKLAAQNLGLPVETPDRARNPDFVEKIRALEADFLLVAAYGQILSVALLESARNGGINLHGSILPAYRGAAPIQRAIQDGCREIGVTLMQMAKGMDTGDMIAIERLAIGHDETYGELAERLGQLAGTMAKEWAPRLASGDYPRTPQDESLATHAAKVEKQEAQLQFAGSAQREYDRFRAFTPSPGAFLETRLGAVRVSKALLGTDEAATGTVTKTSPNLEVAFDQGSIQFLEVQPAGKKRMAGRDFANGARIRVGDSLLPELDPSASG